MTDIFIGIVSIVFLVIVAGLLMFDDVITKKSMEKKYENLSDKWRIT